MQPSGVITGAHVQRIPGVTVHIIDGVVFFAGKAEEPVARSKGGDVRLIHLADGEGAGNALVAALHGGGILGIERAALLVYHNAVIAQGVIAVAVKFAGEKPLRRAERVGGVHNDKVIFILTLADELECVFVIDMHAAVIHTAGVAGQVGAASFNNLGVHFHQVNALHTVIAGQFPHNAAIARADDEDVLCASVHRHRHMGDHFIVNELIALRQHDIAVQRKHPAKFRRFKNINALVVTLFGIELAVDPDAVLYIGGMKFRKPHFHCTNLLLNVYLKTKKMTDTSQTQAGCKAKSRGNPLWIPRLFKATPHNSRLAA